ncbi:hypothetical protein DFH07DRAFT_290727 [Mycena maculata]|uniref:Uncharacterized protein n=1 Tax=Mycena maculata TaxID=230809 RepID=A0AAD7NPL6_9AGAR|nr:hypothetical protein DFH07DRAFT_290727 [Mycena maculata]
MRRNRTKSEILGSDLFWYMPVVYATCLSDPGTLRLGSASTGVLAGREFTAPSNTASPTQDMARAPCLFPRDPAKYLPSTRLLPSQEHGVFRFFRARTLESQCGFSRPFLPIPITMGWGRCYVTRSCQTRPSGCAKKRSSSMQIMFCNLLLFLFWTNYMDCLQFGLTKLMLIFTTFSVRYHNELNLVLLEYRHFPLGFIFKSLKSGPGILLKTYTSGLSPK